MIFLFFCPCAGLVNFEVQNSCFFVPVQVWCTLKFKTCVLCPCAGLAVFLNIWLYWLSYLAWWTHTQELELALKGGSDHIYIYIMIPYIYIYIYMRFSFSTISTSDAAYAVYRHWLQNGENMLTHTHTMPYTLKYNHHITASRDLWIMNQTE